VIPVLSSRRIRSSRGVARAPRSSTAGRAGHEPLRRRDLEVLGWLAEQYGARVDQIEVLMDTMNPSPTLPSTRPRSSAGWPRGGLTTDNDWRMR
jgi:hypothetical protein